MVRTRFAPSPTGSLHVGNARIAVLNWLFARQNDGVFILRIEDTDEERTVESADSQIIEDLEWLDLDFDEGPGRGRGGWAGPNAPYYQSQRRELYQEYAEWMLAAGVAYRCYCSPAELEARREAAVRAGRPAHYDGRCLHLSQAEIADLEQEGRVPAIRFHVEAGSPVEVEDIVRGTVRFPREDIGDFVILRSDGRPTYNFAVVVDDALMEITHVIRGVGHLSNTPRQILLFEALSHPTPIFAHVPTVLGPDRQKLSKRHGDAALADYRRQGYHKDAIVNYLSLLSWSSPSGDEFLTRDRLIREISLERIRASDAVFDPAKLRFLSARHIEHMPLDQLTEAVEPFIDHTRFPVEPDTLRRILEVVRSHLSTFADVNEQLAVFYPGRDEADGPRSEISRSAAARRVLQAAAAAFQQLDSWDEAAIRVALQETGRQAGVGGQNLYVPLRVTVTGQDHGPPLAPMLSILGRERVLSLLSRAAGI